MDLQKRTRRFGMYVILCACLLRFFTGGLWLNMISETGQDVRFLSSPAKNLSYFRESPAPWVRWAPYPVFMAEDAGLVELDNDTTLTANLEGALEKPLAWDLTGPEPSVLIYHTHTTESYTPSGETYPETADFRTLSEEHNMLCIGDRVAQLLTQAGIAVLHDRQLHDYPSYNGSYVHARSAVEEILAEYPTIALVLDLHRDALEQDGRQLRTLAEAAGRPSAQLMLVVGTNVTRQAHKNWEDNLSLAVKLHAQLQRMYPGIMRPLNLRSERFNQDLSAGALLIEVGAAGNTRQEALTAAEALASAVVELAQGTG